MVQLVKNSHAIQKTWVQSLGWEDPLEKGRLPIPVFWLGEFHGLNSVLGHQESDVTSTFTHRTFTKIDFIPHMHVCVLDHVRSFETP